MAGLRVTAFVPDAWIELRALLQDLLRDRAGLHRWDGCRSEDGARLRSAAVVRNEGGPSIEALAAFALERARAAGASTLRKLHRHAELDLESHDTFCDDPRAVAPPRDRLRWAR